MIENDEHSAAEIQQLMLCKHWIIVTRGVIYHARRSLGWKWRSVKSPDMNLFKMGWAQLKVYLKRIHKPTNKAELGAEIKKFWKVIHLKPAQRQPVIYKTWSLW